LHECQHNQELTIHSHRQHWAYKTKTKTKQKTKQKHTHTTIKSNTDTTKKRDEPKVPTKGMYYRNYKTLFVTQ